MLSIDDKGNLIDFVSTNYLYEITELVRDYRTYRGLVMYHSITKKLTFLSRHSLIYMSERELGFSKVKPLVKIVNEYHPRKQIVIVVTNSDIYNPLAVGVIDIKFQSINLRG